MLDGSGNEMAVPVDVRYEAGHSSREIWDKTEYFCPNCLEQHPENE